MKNLNCQVPTPLLVALSVLALGAMSSCEKAPAGPELAPLPTGAWIGGGYLLLRNDGDTLLLRHLSGSEREWYERGKDDFETEHPKNKVVYRYKPMLGTLEEVGANEWKAANSPVVDCARSRSKDAAPFDWDGRSMTLRFRGTPAKTAGQTVLNVRISPDKKYVSVLTAEGPYEPSPIPFLGGGKASGPRRHELLSPTDGSRLGEALRLVYEPGLPPIGGCWSQDGRFLVYADSANSRVWIVPGPKLPSEQAKSNQPSSAGSKPLEKTHD